VQNQRGLAVTETFRRSWTAAFTVFAVAVGAMSPGHAVCDNPDCRYIIIVPFGPGGPTDVIARVLGQSLSKQFEVVVENLPGGGGIIAGQAVARAKPDGSRLLMLDASVAINATLFEGRGFDLPRDIAPVASVASVPSVLVVNPSLPAKTVSELLAYAKANPGKVFVGSAGNGTASHLSGELFRELTGIDIVHVPYRGSNPAIADLISDRVQMSFVPIALAIEPIRAGRLRALAVTSATRSALLPDVPTLADFVPGYEAGGWIGLGAPSATPAEIIDKRNKQINAALADPAVKEQLAKLGASILADSPAGFGRLIATDTQKWARVIKANKIKAE
jgi:tripartite-type tricarboxylate transporter receptor subunit TctC